MNRPRVAFFTDSYHEVNGVALTSREFARFARARDYAFFSVHTGPQTKHWREGNFETLEIAHSTLRLGLEHDLAFDLLFLRHLGRAVEALRAFRPDLVHITGPGHCGLMGAIAAHRLRIPLVASWHTNLHEFASLRLQKMLHRLPREWRRTAAGLTERRSLDVAVSFYRLARIVFAPNPDLVTMLASRTRRPSYLMNRGIDTDLFSPARRNRRDETFTIGYVGRLSPEKSVRMLADLEANLAQAGLSNVRFLVVGEGNERAWLAANLRNAEFTGVLRGQALAEAYANMDVFVFPSRTDTFGNVVLEAFASGVPTVVASEGGPKFLVRQGVDGYIANDLDDYVRAVTDLHADRAKLGRMRDAARATAEVRSWDDVFESVYCSYAKGIAAGILTTAQPRLQGLRSTPSPSTISPQVGSAR